MVVKFKNGVLNLIKTKSAGFERGMSFWVLLIVPGVRLYKSSDSVDMPPPEHYDLVLRKRPPTRREWV